MRPSKAPTLAVVGKWIQEQAYPKQACFWPRPSCHLVELKVRATDMAAPTGLLLTYRATHEGRQTWSF